MKELVNNHLQATNGQLGAAGHDGQLCGEREQVLQLGGVSV